MGFRFLHAADLHLDTPFQGLRSADDRLGQLVADSTLAAFESLVDLALSEDVSFVVLAGDIYDGSRRGLRAQVALRDGLKRLDQEGIPVFIAQGNHDPLSEGYSVLGALPPRCVIFPPRQVRRVSFEAKDGSPVEVQGVSYAETAEVEDLSKYFERPDPSRFTVAVLHASAGEYPEHSTYSPTSVSQLSARGFDYWALGHIHRAQVLQERNPTIVYPGNTQGLSIKDSELGEKGAVVVSVEANEVRSVDFKRLGPVVFLKLEYSFDRDYQTPEIEISLVEQIRESMAVRGEGVKVVRLMIEADVEALDQTAWEAELRDRLNSVLWDVDRDVFIESTRLQRPAAMPEETPQIFGIRAVLLEESAKNWEEDLSTAASNYGLPSAAWESPVWSAEVASENSVMEEALNLAMRALMEA